jgi:hypothetical protein
VTCSGDAACPHPSQSKVVAAIAENRIRRHAELQRPTHAASQFDSDKYFKLFGWISCAVAIANYGGSSAPMDGTEMENGTPPPPTR